MGVWDLMMMALFGLVAGAIARLLHPGRDPMNWVWTMLLGIGGALLGGFVGYYVLGVNTGGPVMRWVLAIGGSIALLVIYHALTATRAAYASGGAATNADYKAAVYDDLARGPNE